MLTVSNSSVPLPADPCIVSLSRADANCTPPPKSAWVGWLFVSIQIRAVAASTVAPLSVFMCTWPCASIFSVVPSLRK